MTKNIDLDKKLSDEDRAWLKERSLDYMIEANDRQFGVEHPYEAPNLKAHEFYDDEHREEHMPKFAQRPSDPQVTGVWAAQTVVPGENPNLKEAEEGEETEIEYLTVEELKEELRERDLSTSGNKEALVERLNEALKKEQ